MAWERNDSPLIWVLVACLLVQGLLVPVMSTSLEDQKNYYSPEPHTGTPPTGSQSPPHRSTPSTPRHHGSTPSTPRHHGSPPDRGYSPTPSTPSPPSNCGNPPKEPSTPLNPPSGGGGYYNPPPSGGGYYNPPPSGGGYYNPPPSDGGYYNPPPSDGGYYNPPPSGGDSPPAIVSPPSSIVPGTPTIPTPPFLPDPNTPVPGTCTYWSTHPTLIWGLLGWWGSVGNAFGVTSLPGFGANMNLQQALSNTRTDGYGSLYREATASWLNSLVNHRFPFTTNQVRQNFVAALHSDKAAGAQAQLFKLANEGRLKT